MKNKTQKPPEQLDCLFCGKKSGYHIRKDRGTIRYARKFCSAFCNISYRHKQNNTAIYIECPICKKQFRKYPKDGVARKNCSMKCYNTKRVNNFPKYNYPEKQKKNYKTKKIKGKAILAHRWTMEQHLGRKLTPKEIVHHINGDRHDNRLENLMLTTQSEHMKIEMRQWKLLSQQNNSKS